MAVTQRSFKDYALARLQREVAYATSIIAIAGSGSISDTNTLAEILALELTTTGYSRINATPQTALTYTWDGATFTYTSSEREYASTITGGAVLPIQWTATLFNATSTWSSAVISTVNATADTIAYPTPAGVTPANGDRVIVTADAGGALPAGLSATTIYTLQSVSNSAGTTTAKLRAVGAGADTDITSTGTNPLRVRNASGELDSYWTESSPQSVSSEWRIKHRFSQQQLRLS